MEAVFRAYFIQGATLATPGCWPTARPRPGWTAPTVIEFLASDVAEAEMRAADQAAREAGVNGVPSFFLDGYSLFSGAMPAAQMAEAFRRGRAILQQREA